MAETLTKAAAEKKFRELTAQLHDARARQDRLRATELANERDLLAQALYPGDNAPTPDQKRTI
jgi:hypothetical protein